MIKRAISDKVIALARKFPVITITGPRQSGKTTLAKALFKNHAYVSIEEPNEREFALRDPKGFLNRFAGNVILDEIQRAPSLLSYIQGIVDSDGSPGRYIITGSQQFNLLNTISQTLAGRTALVQLLPFTVGELQNTSPSDPWEIQVLAQKAKKPTFTLEEILLKGFYPRIHDKELNPQDWLSAYYRTYVERDVRTIANIGDLESFQRFIRLCAGRTGQLLNLSSLSADCGISHTTARSWISILQASYIIHLVSPHYKNFSKRIIKSPKLYFIDTGLLCYLLRIRRPDEIPTHSMKGAIFETFAVAEIYKAFINIGETPPVYFWRDRTGHEVDVIIDAGNTLIPMEIKSSMTIDGSFFSGLNYYASLSKNTSKKGVLIYGGDEMYEREKCLIRPWYQCV